MREGGIVYLQDFRKPEIISITQISKGEAQFSFLHSFGCFPSRVAAESLESVLKPQMTLKENLKSVSACSEFRDF